MGILTKLSETQHLVCIKAGLGEWGDGEILGEGKSVSKLEPVSFYNKSSEAKLQ